jgi:adenosine deaminase
MIVRCVLVVLVLCAISPAQTAEQVRQSSEQATGAYMESIRNNPAELVAFLRAMPKGGDLHNHLTGAIYAENYIRFGIDRNFCIDMKTFVASKPPCTSVQVPLAKSSLDPVLYRNIVDNWSMRNWQSSGQSGADHFFDAFWKFDALTYDTFGEMFAEAQQRAAQNNVSYLELMVGTGTPEFMALGSKTKWNEDFSEMRNRLLQSGLKEAVARTIAEVNAAEAKRDKLLNCSEKRHVYVGPPTGCQVSVRYILHVLRGFPKEQVFAQLLGGFELATADPRFVSLDLVMPEHSLVPTRDFTLHMRMLDFFHKLYPEVRITMHAGELAPGIVPPEGLRSHIRQTIEMGHAERIGHGVGIMHEDDPVGLMQLMAERNIMVEICLTSNDMILGLKGAAHPLRTYMKHGVPVALATDDEGVARSDITHEYLKGVQEQGLTYSELKTMARTSLEHAFITGASYWRGAKDFGSNHQCANPGSADRRMSSACEQLVNKSAKAKLQLQLEDAFQSFERRMERVGRKAQ